MVVSLNSRLESNKEEKNSSGFGLQGLPNAHGLISHNVLTKWFYKVNHHTNGQLIVLISNGKQ